MKDPADLKQFAQELTRLQRPLFVYITRLVSRPADAEDVLQEVNRVLWEKIEGYQPGTNLGAWAARVAYYEVLTWRKRQARQRLRFSDHTLELIADEAGLDSEAESDERQALHGCLDKLPPADRDLITRRYLGE